MIIILYDTNRLKETEPVPLICIDNLDLAPVMLQFEP